VSRTNVSTRTPELSGFWFRSMARSSIAAPAWMATAFFVSLALAAIVLIAFGAGEHGTVLALRLTARWCFLLFWPAYAGGALAKLGGPRFSGLARRGRAFGLAFASALLVHIGLVLWLIETAADQRGPMILFWAGTLCTYLLALLSVPRLRDMLGQRLWQMICTLALDYIALVFAVDFILEPLRAGEYPLSYLPFAAALIGGAALRLAAFLRPLWTVHEIGR
jgi:hypothetical protein